MINKKSFMKQYIITALVLFFLIILLFNLVRTYSKYEGVLSKVENIQTLLTNVSNQNSKLKKEYHYYSSSYYRNKVASNDLNLVNGSNIYEYSVPRSSSNNYINLSRHHIQSKHIKTSTSFIGWMRLLF